MREHRIPIMMSDGEVEAVDEYRFANRIGTRSGAVRALCSKALQPESQQVGGPKLDLSKPNRILDGQVRVLSVGETHLGSLELDTEQGFIPLAINRNVAYSLIAELAAFMAATEVDEQTEVANDG